VKESNEMKKAPVSAEDVARIVTRGFGLFFLVQAIPSFRHVFIAYGLLQNYREEKIPYKYGFEQDLFYPILFETLFLLALGIYLTFWGGPVYRFLTKGRKNHNQSEQDNPITRP